MRWKTLEAGAVAMPFKSKLKAEEWRLQWRIRNRERLRAQRLAWEERNQERLREYRLSRKAYEEAARSYAKKVALRPS